MGGGSIWLRSATRCLQKQSPSRRDDFLLEMYRQCSNHLNRHILVTWQSVGVVAGALAVFLLGDKADLNTHSRLDFVIGIMTLLCAWLYAHLYDANNWFDRNLHIISNIERQFLKPSDSSEIHYYFTLHRSQREGNAKLKLAKHFQIQWLMTVVLWFLVLAYHFYQRVYPGLRSPIENFEAVRSIPYVLTTLCLIYCVHVAKDRKKDYEDLLRKSPGKKT